MTAIVILSVITLLLLAAGMVLSYMSSSPYGQKESKNYHIASLVSSGLAMLSVVIVLIVHSMQGTCAK